MDIPNLSWHIEPDDMFVQIRYNDIVVMKISVHEIVESSSRTKILSHVIECDRTPWLKRWQKEKELSNENSQLKVADILRGTF